MTRPTAQRWMHAALERSGLRALAARSQHELDQHQNAARALQSWKAWLLRSRHSVGLPLLVGALAVVSAGSGLFPFVPVLVAAVVFAPARWSLIYLSASLGAAIGAALLAWAIQLMGEPLVEAASIRPDAVPHWLEGLRLIERYGPLPLAAVAALPVPQTPVLLALAVAKVPPLTIGLAVLIGKLAKYGLYVAGTRLALKLFRSHDGPPLDPTRPSTREEDR